MSERLPYEEQLNNAWDDLPLPDEDMAWADMKRRLDEDDDDPVIVPPPRGCGIGTILIGLLLLGGLWLWIRPEKWFYKNQTETTPQTTTTSNNKREDGEKTIREQKEKTDKNIVNTNIELENDKTNKIAANDTATGQVIPNQQTNTKIENKESAIKNPKPLTIKDQTKESTPPTKAPSTQRKQTVTPERTKRNVGFVKLQPKKETVSREEKVTTNEESVSDQKKKEEVERKIADVKTGDKPHSTVDKKTEEVKVLVQPIDSVLKNKIDSTSLKKTDTVVKETRPSKQKDKEKKPVFFSAGIGLHQQIPVGGQEWVSYGSLGRKGILSDYIPSVNFRMEKQDRWFLQTEFRYGAPQHTTQFIYDQVIKLDTFSQSIITTSVSLRKTFYHQLPLTFNYYVLPNWSVGTGIQWNKFYSAIADEDVRRRIAGTTNDSIISQKTIKVNPDSTGALAKSWFQGIVQTQYQWKRFSIGARYSFGLQPYIKFALPNQPLQEEKNNSLQIFLRYELWKSKKNN